MSIRLGSVPAIVVSSPQAAEIFLKTHDVVFASKPKFQVIQSIYNGKMGIEFTEYGPYWHNLRKFCNQQLFTALKIESFAPSRKKVLTHFVESLKEAAAVKEVVNISKKVGNLNVEMILNMILGPVKKYEEFNLKELIEELLYMVRVFNLADFVPFLGAFDLQRLKARTRILAITIDMIVASLDTSTAPFEWALSTLIKHPRVMLKLQKELERIIGKRMVEENDLPKLEYLDMVVKETLRLYPVAPMLIPRESMEDIVIDGCYIPKKSRVIVNIWAIGRDPNAWSNNVEELFPKRFINRNIELHEHDFELIPFGSSRRVCPGRKLTLITVKLILAQLVHCFDWELPGGMSPNEFGYD
ncbi:cytochrome P450 CYP736A12-like protein [Gossypium australe]|uniref:Cytochrome P450 CYP736A12-like protein n=1 Tax=Gossypium australe TaxID=47621 RepID=A0A5B6UC37_9ROSI|nr:cytochrome P450 CYP736A12-like protein [Gossypium australe]